MEIFLSCVPLWEIFSYLDTFSLLQAAQVNKSWHEVSGSDLLWRGDLTGKLCLKRWPCCDIRLELLNAQTWKQFFLRQTRQEYSMTWAKPEDFIYKEIPRDFGLGDVNYLSGRGLTREGQGRSVVCVVISLTRLSAWDLQETT
ncbi:F-box/WD repeat-containing protein 12 [Chionomys nivalis]|uniref:F-box/WD repeat-containing protein 12 n=1 Tax=Chionomys nivalis TaxID=269649 RepID=UPI0025978CD9|nr:F-box/WD repeat-containing protein 12 [Chionomys nivalis]